MVLHAVRARRGACLFAPSTLKYHHTRVPPRRCALHSATGLSSTSSPIRAADKAIRILLGLGRMGSGKTVPDRTRPLRAEAEPAPRVSGAAGLSTAALGCKTQPRAQPTRPPKTPPFRPFAISSGEALPSHLPFLAMLRCDEELRPTGRSMLGVAPRPEQELSVMVQ